MLISINMPHMQGEYDGGKLDFEAGKWGPLGEAGVRIRERILMTLEVKDWSLFGTDGEREAEE